MLVICRIISASAVAIFLASPIHAVAEELREVNSSNIIEKFDAGRDGVGYLLLPVVIDKKKYSFLLDTGSTDLMYDVSFRSMFGIPKEKLTYSTLTGGTIKTESFNSPEAFLGKINLKTVTDVGIIDLSLLRKWSGGDFYGLIGMSFLKHHIVRIDFDTGQVLFLKSLGRKPGQAFRLSFQEGIPCTKVTISGWERREKFAIDTGADTNISGYIRFDLYNLLAKCHVSKTLAGSYQSIVLSGETVTNSDFRLNALSIGPFTHRNFIFSTSPKYYDNTLGLGFLSRYVVTFDFPNRVMYLQKGKMFDLPDGSDRSGLSISRHAGKTVVTRVAWFSPAWWGGIKPQDVVLKIEGNCANQTSLYSLRRLLGMEGKKTHLVLQRGQERMEVSLMLSCDPDKVSNDSKAGRIGKEGSIDSSAPPGDYRVPTIRPVSK